jgi:major membrane immunogen (membrane-anchored lipoprotein)
MRLRTSLVAVVLLGACGSSDKPESTVNPKRLWMTGPESNMHLAEAEPDTPF